mgnify:CR=1 FL=1
MPQKNKTNNSKKNLANYRTRTRTQTQTQPTITHARYSVVFRPEQDPPSRARITAGGDRLIDPRTVIEPRTVPQADHEAHEDPEDQAHEDPAGGYYWNHPGFLPPHGPPNP